MKIIYVALLFSVILMSEKECNDFKLTKTGKKVNQREAMITLNILVIIRCSPCFWLICILLSLMFVNLRSFLKWLCAT